MRRRDFIGVLSRATRMWGASHTSHGLSAANIESLRSCTSFGLATRPSAPAIAFNRGKTSARTGTSGCGATSELGALQWRCRKQIEVFRARGQWEGVADLMRYEILHEHGGVYVDVRFCLHPPAR